MVLSPHERAPEPGCAVLQAGASRVSDDMGRQPSWLTDGSLGFPYCSCMNVILNQHYTDLVEAGM